jgi:hypothetical protein
MLEEVSQLHLTTNRLRERAKLFRHYAQGVSSALLRQDLLDIACEYEGRAESTKEPGNDGQIRQAGPMIQAICV